MDKLFTDYYIDTVVHFVAEYPVYRSIEDSKILITTNILGIQNLLDIVKNHWKVNPKDKHYREFKDGVKFLHVSTD